MSLKYRIAVKERNLDAILSMFAPDAVIETPLRGTCKVRPYHEWLFENVKRSTVEVQNVFQALNGDITIAIHSRYRWLLNNDKTIEFGGMSLFEFTPDRTKIRKMTTFYDTSLVRSELAQAMSPG
ncbi:nuclear transport factor 2 family protein [Noviherbaspirillum humi]|uniref:nuclear transport factor 2 family protein n=1 Tax=Noviherbaspirillum humi TaxID=1688639 RepID=UPI001595C4C4|nr:nuclear transport factor 2 family protein [Noviherbaspirillum humi]